MAKKVSNPISLPNSSTVLYLGLFAFLAPTICYCFGGAFWGPLLAIIVIIIASVAKKRYNKNPDLYTDSSLTSLKIGKIAAIVGLVFNICWWLFTIFFNLIYLLMVFILSLMEIAYSSATYY